MDRRTLMVWLVLFSCFAGCGPRVYNRPTSYKITWELHGKEYSRHVQSTTTPEFIYQIDKTVIRYREWPEDENVAIYLHRDAAPIGEGVEIIENRYR